MTEEELGGLLSALADERAREARRTMGFVAQERLQAEAHAIRAGAVAINLMPDLRVHMEGYVGKHSERKLATTRDTIEKGLALIDRLLGKAEAKESTDA